MKIISNANGVCEDVVDSSIEEDSSIRTTVALSITSLSGRAGLRHPDSLGVTVLGVKDRPDRKDTLRSFFKMCHSRVVLAKEARWRTKHSFQMALIALK